MAKKIYYAFGYEPGPSYVTDGLVAYWDAGNPASYAGSGSDWFDLSGNSNDASLFGGVLYEAANKRFVMNASSANTAIDASNVSWANTGEFSIEVTFEELEASMTYLMDSNTPRTLIGYNNAPFLNGFNYYTGGSWRNIGVWNNAPAHKRIAITVNGTSIKGYINNSLVGVISATYNDISNTKPWAFFNRYTALSGGASGPQKCYLNQIMIYNKELSSLEVSQNYLAFQPIFGY